MYFLNSTECESLIVQGLDYECAWHPETYHDSIMYTGTVIDDRNEDDGITHRFEWTTLTELSDETLKAANETLRKMFNVRGRYEETAGKACSAVFLHNPKPCVFSTDTSMLVYKIEVSYYHDI
jgi:L-ascorbate metabolism protein UlaG (beta-lactamase superfamily)